MANIVISAAAENDLAQIGDYFAIQQKSPRAARTNIKVIKMAISKLADFPFIGTPLSSITELDTDYRFLGCGSYLAFYRVMGNDVYIDRVIHRRRDFIAILFGELPSDD